MKPVRFHPEAEAEMISAAKFYESQQTDLGKRFLTSVQDALNRIQINPLLYPEIEDGVRRCLTITFPFAVVFQIKPDQYEIISVMHLHREPATGKSAFHKSNSQSVNIMRLPTCASCPTLRSAAVHPRILDIFRVNSVSGKSK